MCSISLGLSIASSAFGLIGQMQQQRAQEKYNDAVYKNAVIANNQRNAQITSRQIQERDAATSKIMNNNIEAAKAKSTAQVSASSGGVSGISVDALVNDLSMMQGRYNSSVTENLRASYMGLDDARVNSYNDMASTINGLTAPKTPNYLGAALQIGTAVNDYNTRSGGKLYPVS